MYPKLFAFGPLTIPTYGALAAVGLVLAMLLAMRIARAMRLDEDAIWNLGMIAVCSAFVGSRLLLIATNWQDFLHFPVLMLSAASLNSGGVFYGGLIFAIAVCIAYLRWKRMPLLRTLDAIAPALALAHTILMLGAFAAGSSYGTPTTVPWAVTFHNKYAALWSGAPLGVPLHPAQLYEAAAALALCLFLLWLLRHRLHAGSPAQDGEVFGAWLFLGGIAHFVIEFYRGDPGRGSLFGGLATLTQGFALILVVAGALLWLDRNNKPANSPGSGHLMEQNALK